LGEHLGAKVAYDILVKLLKPSGGTV
jgi:hypothetical protein